MLRTFFSPRKSCRLWDNVIKYGGARQVIDDGIVWRMSIACWITRVQTHTATMVRRRRLGFTWYVHCMYCFNSRQWLRSVREVQLLVATLSILRTTHEWIWNTGGIITDEENLKSSERNPLKSLSTTNLAWTALGVNPDFRGEKPAIKFLSLSTITSGCLTSCGIDNELERTWKGMALAWF